MNELNMCEIIKSIKNIDEITNDLFKEVIESYELTIDSFNQQSRYNQEELNDNLTNQLLKKTNKNYHTITSKSNFNNLTEQDDTIPTLLYTPLNDHSRDYLSKGDILFSYRSGQFSDLDEALKMRGIYGLGIALSNPLRIYNDHEGRDDYKNYGIIIIYPFRLRKHLSVRDVQLNPNTINLTPYNGNRNDSLQYIPEKKHYNHLMGMILKKNPHLKHAFRNMNLNITEKVIPDEVWNERREEYDDFEIENYKEEFEKWLQNEGHIKIKTKNNYISGLNTLERIWNENNYEKINIWEEPYTILNEIGEEDLLNDEYVKNKNKEQNNTLKAATNYYFKFISELNNGIIGRNKLFFGAPGTGKSFKVSKFIRENGVPNYNEKLDNDNVFRVTLHPEFNYSDFIGQVMPVVLPITEDGQETRIEYKFSPQIFTQALKYALNHKRIPVFLVLEEMSRANVSQVFGDVFQLLDRDLDGESEYRIDNQLIANEIWKDESKKIYLPNNLFILGTVNTSDQNVFVMDTAFKRRFEFEYMDAYEVAVDKYGQSLNNFVFELLDENNETIKFDWISFYKCVNNFITNTEEKGLGLTEDKQLGQFFIKFKKDNYKYNYDQLSGKLIEYLWNDVQNASFGELSLFRGNISNFSQLYRSFKNKENVFSSAFLEEYYQMKKTDDK